MPDTRAESAAWSSAESALESTANAAAESALESRVDPVVESVAGYALDTMPESAVCAASGFAVALVPGIWYHPFSISGYLADLLLPVTLSCCVDAAGLTRAADSLR